MSRRLYGPFNRVEGDLEVQVEIEQGVVTSAWVNSPLFRGFEQILQGRDPRDALVYTPRICGICSVSQSVAAATALARAMGLELPANGRLATNLILSCENLADHLTHFYLFFMPDFAREVYAGRPWHDAAVARFRALEGSAAAEVLPARAGLLHLTGVLAGKWPHSLSIQPGGTTRPVEPHEKARLLQIIGQFRRFLERTLFGDRLEAVSSLESAEALRDWAGEHGESDFGRFLGIADDLALAGLGRAGDRFLSYGAYALEQGHLFRCGTWSEGRAAAFDPLAIREDLSHSWMKGQEEPAHPREGVTIPRADKAGAYSWCKAPRLQGQAMETGALARQVVDGHPLIRDLVGAGGGSVFTRVVARLLELALLVPVMEEWVRALEPGGHFCNSAAVPAEAEGAGLVEAARGSLGHWLRIRKGRILNYQIIAPTTWNFSPRDAGGSPGPLEQALVGVEVGEEGRDSVRIQHVVRSFDPCMVCTVH